MNPYSADTSAVPAMLFRVYREKRHHSTLVASGAP